MTKEEWLPVAGYEGSYEVSNMGQVKSLDRYITIQSHTGGNQYQKHFDIPAKTVFRKGRTLKLKDYNGYKRVDLCRKPFSVHRLVAIAFIPNPENKPHVNHIDNNPSNNNVSNLEWCTRVENIQHAVKQNRMMNGERIWQAKLTEDDVREIRKSNLSAIKIGELYNINRRQVYRIKRKIQWKHII